MDEPSGEPDLARLIAESVLAHRERARLAQRLWQRAWPAGGRDRTRPSAREWLRRWGPVRSPAEPLLPACGCAYGRCVVCN
jgi:hypothetical protein